MNRQRDTYESGHPTGDDLRRRLLVGTSVTERRLGLGGVSTAVLEGGKGTPVVLLHGQGGFAPIWMPILPDLMKTHAVIAPDLPGLGASEMPDGPPDAERVLSWLGELIERTCATPPALVGMSLGGSIAARFAIASPDRVSGLVLVDSGSLGRFRPPPSLVLAMVGMIARPGERSQERFLRQVAFAPERIHQRMGEQWQQFAAYQIDRVRTPSVRTANRQLLRELGTKLIPPEDLARIAVPTSMIWGRHDRVMPLRYAKTASARYGWPLHVIEDAGHLSFVEQPDAVLRALRVALAASQTAKGEFAD